MYVPSKFQYQAYTVKNAKNNGKKQVHRIKGDVRPKGQLAINSFFSSEPLRNIQNLSYNGLHLFYSLKCSTK